MPRARVWITDKVNTYGGGGAVRTRAGARASVEASLGALGVPYIDLMLVHGTWTLDAAEQVDVSARARGLGGSGMKAEAVLSLSRRSTSGAGCSTRARPGSSGASA